MNTRLSWIRRRAWQIIRKYQLPTGQHWGRRHSIHTAVLEAAQDRSGLYHD